MASTADLSWFKDARFGMFIHWGLYSMPAKQEWIRSTERISDEDYQIYFELFNPDLFDPRDWARRAREAGMKYLVFTAKHHEGFCMWDTKFTDYKITNTPFGRDALREILDAFRAEGIRTGIYYSLIDWHHPDFTIDAFHPLRFRKDRDELNKSRDMARYRKYMLGQIRELLTDYGQIDVMWFDFSYPSDKPGRGPEDTGRPFEGKDHNDWGSKDILELVRGLQPGIIIDNRLDLPEAGDFETPEQFTPDDALRDADGNVAIWEGCQTFSGSWGYSRDEMSWKSPKQCIDMLINHVSRGGNMLMNVGPTSRGYFDARACNLLDAYAKWMKYNSRSIYGCGIAPAKYPEPQGGRYTYNPKTNRLYLHLLNWPFKHVMLKDLDEDIRYAQLLHDGSEIEIRRHVDEEVVMCAPVPKGWISLELPAVKPDVEVPVIEMFLK